MSELTLSILKVAGTAFGVGLGLLLIGRLILAFLPFVSKTLQAVLFPISAAAGLVAGYATISGFPQRTAMGPWYMDVAVKMTPVAVGLVGLVLALDRLTPRIVRWVWTLVLAGALAAVVVRSKWEGWAYYAGTLVAMVVGYRWAFGFTENEERLSTMRAVIGWAAAAGAAVLAMAHIDQVLGRTLIGMALLGGVAVVFSLLPFLRRSVLLGGLTLATMAAPLLALLAYYNEQESGPTIPRASWVLLAVAPLAAGLTRTPLARKSMLSAMIAAVMLAGMLAVAAVVVGLAGGPPLSPVSE